MTRSSFDETAVPSDDIVVLAAPETAQTYCVTWVRRQHELHTIKRQLLLARQLLAKLLKSSLNGMTNK